MIPPKAEAWLSNIAGRLQKLLSKAILAGWIGVPALLLSLLELPIGYKIIGIFLWVSLTLNLLLLALWCRTRIQKRQLEGDPSKERERRNNDLDGIETQILGLFYDDYPTQYMKDEVRQKLNLQQIDVDGSLRSLCSKGFLVAPPPFKQLIGSALQNPNGYSITEKGRQKIKNSS